MRIAVMETGATGGYFGGLLARAGESDIQVALWQKFIAICGVNGITTLTRLPMGEILACEETRNLLRGTMEEVEAVARASGATLPEGCVDQSIDFFSR